MHVFFPALIYFETFALLTEELAHVGLGGFYKIR